MFGNGGNSFGALAMDDDQPSAGPSTQVMEGDELDVDWLKLVKTNHDVDVRVSDKIELDNLPNECNLMAVSNIWDLLIVASNNDIRIHKLSNFHELLEKAAKDASPTSNPLQTINLPARPVWIRLAMNEERLVVATAEGSGIHMYRLKDVLNGNTSPYHSFTSDIPQQLLDVLPNPASPIDQQARYVTLLAQEGLIITDVEECKFLAPLTGPFTCASWSAKGKQIVVGTPSGKLVQYTPEGTAKAEIPSPPDLEGFYPISVQWLENDLFFVSYVHEGGQPDDPAETYTIHRNKSGVFTFTKFFDPLNTMGLASRAGFYRHFTGIKAWGEQTKHIAFTVSGASSEIGIFHGNSSSNKEEPPKWEILMLEETARGVLPAAKEGVRDDASVLALALDLTSTKVIQQGIVGGIELPDLAPQPRLLAYTQEGTIISFDIRNADAGPYPSMITPQSMDNSSETPSQTPPTPALQIDNPANAPSAATSSTTPAPSAFGSSAFGSTGFGQTSPAKLASTFGSSAFGTPSKSAFGSSSKPAAFGSASFGQSSTPSSASPAAPPAAFGSTSKPGGAFAGFGQSNASSGFGQSAFGQSSKPAAFGSSAFGSSTTPTSTPAKPSAFGAASTTPSAFGSSSTPSKPAAFGATSTPTSAFGATGSSASAFGQSAFGQSSKPAASSPSAFGSTSTPSAFGSTSSTSNMGFGAFGSAANKSGFGASAFGQTAKPEEKKDSTASPFGSGGSAFGSPSAFGSGGGSAFGSSSAFGQTAFGTKSTPSSSTELPKPAFTGFGPQANDKTKSTPASAFSGFGQKTEGSDKSASAFSGFGQKSVSSPSTESTKSAFAGFGNQSVQTPLPSGFGQAKAPSPVPESKPTNNAEQDDFGLSGFASILDNPTKPTGVPGLDDSSPGSPVTGGNGKPAGLDDETPPNSPPATPAIPQASTTPSSTSAFIKPATAFGGAPSFGGFGQSSSKTSTPAFGAGSTPAALSSSTTTSPSTSAFGSSSAFGKPSTIGSSSPSAFGGHAFGQSSVPVGFGKSSVPASTKPMSNISGGFGAFGVKSDSEKKPTGFGGFASSNNGTSVFGGDSDKEKKPTGFAGFGNKSTTTSIFGSADDSKKTDEKPNSAFGSSMTKSAFSFTDKPPSTPKEEVKPVSLAPPTPEEPSTQASRVEEEVKGFEVPEPVEKPKQESTTPQATPIKKPVDVPSTTPESTPSKSSGAIDTSTPILEYEQPPRRAESSPNKNTFNVGSASVSVRFDGDEEDNDRSYDFNGEDENEEEHNYQEENDQTGEPVQQEDEYEYGDEEYDEDYDEEYDEEEEEEEGEEDEEEEDAEEEVPISARRRRSSSIPPDMSPIKEEVSDELASEEYEEDYEDEQEGEEGEYEEEHSKVESEGSTATARSLTKSPPAWFAKPSKSDKSDSGPTSPTPVSEGASLFARLSPAPSPPPTEKKKELVIPTPIPATARPPIATQAQPKLAPSFSFKHASRTSSPLSAPPENASTTPESSPAKPSASTGLFPAKPLQESEKAEAEPATSAFSLFGNKATENKNDLTSAPPAFGGFSGFGNKAADAKSEEKHAPSTNTGGFGLSGNKPPEQPKSQAPSPGAFSLFGNKPAEQPKPSSPAGGFNLFSNKAPEPVKTETPPSLLGAARTVPPVVPETAKPAFGLGLGRPGSTTPSVSDNKPISFAIPSPAPPSAPSSQAVPSTPAPPPPPSKFVLPTRQALPLEPARTENGQKSMGAIVEKIIVALGDDIDNLKTVLAANAKYHQAFSVTSLPKITADNLSQHDIIAFSSITQLQEIVEPLIEELSELRTNDNGAELKLAELQAKLLKTDMKTGQADKYIKARQDPSFAKVMQIKDLSPEQAANQLRLRKAVQLVENKIEELDTSITGLKRRSERKEQGRNTSQQPALERIQRSVRNIDSAIRDKQQTIDELARRIGSIRMSSASPSRLNRAGSPMSTTSGIGLRNTPRKSTIVHNQLTPKTINFEPTKEILQQVELALNQTSQNNKLMSKLEKIKVARLTKLDNNDDKQRKASLGHGGPVFIDALPLPGQLPSSLIKSTNPSGSDPVDTSAAAKSEVETEVASKVIQQPSTPSFSTPSGNTSTPLPSFGGIKFNLDPGNISDLAKSSSSPSSHRGGSAGGSSRSHTSAAKFIPSSSPSSSSPLAGGSLFEFKKDDKKEDEAAAGKAKPSGFFSFSGFGAK
ncbi:uncharacterized protein L201_002232 [Kwoniella dendrophila CBS 6074]|uniref:Nucleoporin Nup159/Nup146 N-terminal domain-containing protein n=1 Tax=Kwoniella dendrophila CBS 6074 TaxID=1295534 RepID=A0AAX4JS75_9TREE